MRPPQKEFEKVSVDDFVNAEIADIKYDEQHEFSTFNSDEKTIGCGVQFTLNISGLNEPKKTRWFKFSYDDRANLYKLFVAPLVEGAAPYMEFDLDQIKGMKIKMLWKNDKDPRYQSIETVRPIGPKVVPNLPQPSRPDAEPDIDDEKVPF